MTQNIIKIGDKTYQTTSDYTFSIPYNEVQDLRMCDIPNFCYVNIHVKEMDGMLFEFAASRFYYGSAEFPYSFNLSIAFIDKNKQRGYKKALLIKNHFASLSKKWNILEYPYLLGDAYCISYNLSHRYIRDTIPFKNYIAQIMPNIDKFKGSKIKAFLCHTSTDKAVVEKFANLLKSEGAVVWFDKWEINVGDSIVEKINNGLANMTHIIIFLSKTSVSKPWVKKELSVGLMRKLSDNSVNVIPILIDKIELPTILQDIKYADCTDNQLKGFEEAIKALIG